MGNKGFYWFDKYSNLGIYNKNDQISMKAGKTTQYINRMEDQGRAKTEQRLQNARKKNEGYNKDTTDSDRQEIKDKVKKAFKDARWRRFK